MRNELIHEDEFERRDVEFRELSAEELDLVSGAKPREPLNDKWTTVGIILFPVPYLISRLFD